MTSAETTASRTPLLDRVAAPADMKAFSDAELIGLAAELRREMIEAVSVTGGHLGSGLGVVELTVAIHAVFETPRDKLIWDVGHQCYPHKILTGRRDRIRTLRQGGGLSGFTKRAESVFDPFGAAHSSTSVSAGLGFRVAMERTAEEDAAAGDAICVIGDGALSAGMAFEALNNAGALGKRLIVVLNDNAMSIAPPVGAMSAHLEAIDAGEKDGAWFEALGFKYIGPVDGHDLETLLPLMRAVKAEADGPVLIHARTVKGKGYAPAEAATDCYHGVGKFDVETGVMKKATANAPSYTRVFADALIKMADQDERIVAVTAAMPSGTGLDHFAKAHPDRMFDAGIAEQHGVTFAAGMAAGGLRPFAAIYSTFLQRGYDQVVHDVAIQRLPVRFAIDRAGLVGADGATHAGAFDIAYLANLPDFVVMAAGDEAELARMVATAAEIDDRPSAFRYPRGEGVGVEIPENPAPLEIGRGRIMREGERVAILSIGSRLADAMAAAAALEAEGVSTTVFDARFAKPIDAEAILRLARAHEALVTVEEGAVGGFGSQVLQLFANAGLLDGGLKLRTLQLPDRFIDQDSQKAMIAEAGLDATAIAAAAKRALGGL